MPILCEVLDCNIPAAAELHFTDPYTFETTCKKMCMKCIKKVQEVVEISQGNFDNFNVIDGTK